MDSNLAKPILLLINLGLQLRKTKDASLGWTHEWGRNLIKGGGCIHKRLKKANLGRMKLILSENQRQRMGTEKSLLDS